MPTDAKQPEPPIQPSAGEHGVWGYTSDAVGGFGEGYDAQVAHGDENEEPTQADDEALRTKVQKSLGQAHVDSADLKVEVRAGHVTLIGTVRNDVERLQLEGGARGVPGVVSVQSRLILQKTKSGAGPVGSF
jgi:hypothetical protein